MLSEKSESFMANDKLICMLTLFCLGAFFTSIFAMMWTFNLKKLQWDSESPGKQERFY